MAKNQSLPAHLQEKDSRGEENWTTYELHEKPTAWWPKPSLSNPRSTNDIVWAFLRANPILFRFVTKSCPYIYKLKFKFLIKIFGLNATFILKVNFIFDILNLKI